MIIVSDTSPIANLIQINRLELLEQVFGKIIIPPFVHEEIMMLKSFSTDLSSYKAAKWIEIIEPQNERDVKKLEDNLDRGESEAIVLAKELNAQLLLIDERLGTIKAKEQGLNTIGLLGILIDAKEQGFLEKIKPTLIELENNGFYMGQKLKTKVLQRAVRCNPLLPKEIKIRKDILIPYFDRLKAEITADTQI